MRLFLDTNVLIDYISRRKPFYDFAKKLYIASAFGDVKLFCSTHSFLDAEYILRHAIDIKQLREIMAECCSFIQPVSIDVDSLKDGFFSGWPDLEDYAIASAAMQVNADYLLTRDLAGFADSKIPAMTPEEFFELLEKEYQVVYDETEF